MHLGFAAAHSSALPVRGPGCVLADPDPGRRCVHVVTTSRTSPRRRTCWASSSRGQPRPVRCARSGGGSRAGGSSVAAGRREHGLLRRLVAELARPEPSRDQFREWDDSERHRGLATVHRQALAFHPDRRSAGRPRPGPGACRAPDHRDAFEVDVHPADRAQLIDPPQSGPHREADQVWKIRAYGELVGVDLGEQLAAFLGRQTARLGRCVPFGDPKRSSSRTGFGRLPDAARPGGGCRTRCCAPSGGVVRLLRRGAVVMEDGAAGPLEAGVERVDLRDVALVQAQLAEMGQDDLVSQCV